MNVYDFDKTIYYPDSSYHFFLHCLRRHPLAVLPVIPGALLLALHYKRGKVSAKHLKEHLFSFLSSLKNVEAEVEHFWEKHQKHLQDWYIRQRQDDDLIISASPEFLLKPIADKLGVSLIATPMDHRSGKIMGENCHDEEKTKRFMEKYPDASIDAFYSDSLSDSPMAFLSKAAFLVKKGKHRPWPGNKE